MNNALPIAEPIISRAIARPAAGGPRRRERRGVTAVEFALTAPILFVLVFAAFEFSRANLLLHTAKIAAAEGARRGIIPGATAAECRTAARDELTVLGVSQSTIDVTPAAITDKTPEITVSVTVPLSGSNGWIFPQFFLGKSAVETVTFRREGVTVN